MHSTLLRALQPRVLIAGLLASTAYLLEQRIDRRLLPNGYDDLLLWGGLLSRRPRRQRLWGLGVHLLLGTALAPVYAAIAPSFPRLPRWLRGLLFAQLENAVLYPGVPLLNAVHPSVRVGELPSLLTRRYALVEIVRHAVYGAVLGILLPDRPPA